MTKVTKLPQPAMQAATELDTTTASAADAEVVATTAPDDDAPHGGESRPVSVRDDDGRIVAAGGRGDGGKTLYLAWAIERAIVQGRTLYIADADPMNRTLSEIFAAYRPIKPADASDAARAHLIRRLTALAKQTRGSIALDLGGNDRELEKNGRGVDPKKMARLQAWGRTDFAVDSFGVNLTMLYMLRGALNDLTGLKLLLDSAVAKKDLVLVLNHGRAPQLPNGEDPFKAMREHEYYQAAVTAGARVFNMPALPASAGKWISDNRSMLLPALDGEAPEGRQPLDPWEREALAVWLGDMEDEVERTGIGPLLP